MLEKLKMPSPSLLETDRCYLVPLQIGDYPFLEALYANPDVREFLGGPILGCSFSKKFTEILGDQQSQNYVIKLKETNKSLGVISISQHHDGKDYEVSYQIDPEFWGRGFARESLIGLSNYARNILRLNIVIAETQSANLASRKMLEKIGMRLQSTIERFGAEQCIYELKL
jgi:ribosomal-protein-alanine N-acetyltransferase